MIKNAFESSKDLKKFSAVCRYLCLGVVDRDKNPEAFQNAILFRSRVEEYFKNIGLSLYLDEKNGFAHLSPNKDETDESLPRVSGNRPMKYATTVLCVLVRKFFDEHEAKASGEKLLLKRDDLHRSMTPYLPHLKDDVKRNRAISSAIEKIEEYGFVKKTKKDQDLFEVQKIVRSALGADWLGDIKKLQDELATHAKEGLSEED